MVTPGARLEASEGMSWSIGIDTGGTFTDVIALDRSTLDLWTHKVPSTPNDPSIAVLNGIDAFLQQNAGVSGSGISFFAHGTTVATNALLEMKGARCGMLTTRNTSAVLYARTSYHPPQGGMLNPNFAKPPVLIPRSRTVEIDERLRFDGSVDTPLDPDEVLRGVESLVARFDIDSIAVCYLFSFMNRAHEETSRDIILRRFPTLRVSLSCEVAPVIREFTRFSTTILDAYLGPLVESYFDRIGAGLNGRNVPPSAGFVMQSHGGLMTLGEAGNKPVHTLLSGPAGGVVAGEYLSEVTGLRDVVTFDVGGTSTDIAIMPGGKAAQDMAGTIAGYHAAIPMSEISTIGAGGGTLARVGVDGRLVVGPQSAGADPGPACYRRGGAWPTVTDANVVLGYLGPQSFLGGRFEVDCDLARRAVEEKIATPLGMSVEAAAFGIVRIATGAMESEVRLRLLEQGFDPRRFSLIGFGGAGPLHAAMVAKTLGFGKTLIPPHPGIGSAMGLLGTDIKHQFYQSRLRRFAELDAAQVEEVIEELKNRALAQASVENVPAAALRMEFAADIRYSGQGYELSVPFSPPASRRMIAETAAAFHVLHEQKFGNCAPDGPIELVSVRLTTTAPMPKLKLRKIAHHRGDRHPDAHKGSRRALFDACGAFVETPVYDRIRLGHGHRIVGPAIVEQVDSTTLVLPDQIADVDAFGNIIITSAQAELSAEPFAEPSHAD